MAPRSSSEKYSRLPMPLSLRPVDIVPPPAQSARVSGDQARGDAMEHGIGKRKLWLGRAGALLAGLLLFSTGAAAQENGGVPAGTAPGANPTITIFGPEDWASARLFGPYFFLSQKPGPLPPPNQPVARTYSPEEQRVAVAALGLIGLALTTAPRGPDLTAPSHALAGLMEAKKFDARAELRALLGEAAARAGLKAGYAIAKRDYSGYVVTRNGAVATPTTFYLDVSNFVIGYASRPEEPELAWPILGARVRVVGESDDVSLYDRRFDTDYGTPPPGSTRRPPGSGSKTTLNAQAPFALQPAAMLGDGEKAIAGMRAVLAEFVRALEPELAELAHAPK